MIEVGHYGLHRSEGGIAFLHQAKRNQSLFQGLESPFYVQTPHGVRCNHEIDIFETSDEPLIDDPLVTEMVPLPRDKPGFVFFNDPRGELKLPLLALARMSWPIRSIVLPAWAVTPEKLWVYLNTTNVQPLVLTDCTPAVTKLVRKIHQISTIVPRRLILTGTPMALPDSIERLDTDLHSEDLNGVDWEGIGSRQIYNYMTNMD